MKSFYAHGQPIPHGTKVVVPAGHAHGTGKLRHDIHGEVSGTDHNENGHVFHRVRWTDKKGKDRTTYAHPHELRTI